MDGIAIAADIGGTDLQRPLPSESCEFSETERAVGGLVFVIESAI